MGVMWESAMGQGEGVGPAALPSGCEPWACQHREWGGVQWTGVLSDPAPGCPALSLDDPDSEQQPDIQNKSRRWPSIYGASEIRYLEPDQ